MPALAAENNPSVSSGLSALVRLVVADARALGWVIVAWLALLSYYAYRFSLRDPVEALDFQPVLWLGGPLLAGAFVLRHPVTRRAAWRTRPWPRTLLFAAKLVEVALFVWLPAAALQLGLLGTLEIARPQWGLHVLELALHPGAWMLAGAALAGYCSSFLAFVGVFVLAMQALALVFLLPQGLRFTPAFVVVGLLVVAATSLIALASTYVLESRRRSLKLSLPCLLLLIPAHVVDWSDFAAPPPSAARLVDLRGPERPPGPSSLPAASPEGSSVPICAGFRLVDTGAGWEVPRGEDGRISYVVEFAARGLPSELAQHLSKSSQKVFLPGNEANVHPVERFAAAPVELVRQYLDHPFDLEIQLTFEGRAPVLGRVPLRTGAVLEGVSSAGEFRRYRIAAVSVDAAGGEIRIDFETGNVLDHLLQGAKPNLSVELVGLPAGFHQRGGGWRPPTIALPYGLAQSLSARRSVMTIASPAQSSLHGAETVSAASELESLASELEIALVEQRLLWQVEGTFEDVTLAELICEP